MVAKEEWISNHSGGSWWCVVSRGHAGQNILDTLHGLFRARRSGGH